MIILGLNIAVSNYHFRLKYCLNKNKTQEVCDKAVDDFLAALKFVPDLFLTSKMIGKLRNALFADDDIIFFDEDSDNVTLRWLFLVCILIRLTLMTLIFMKIILNLFSFQIFGLAQ